MSSCGECGLRFQGDKPGDGPDPCIGRIPGVRGACCGHGKTSDAYVVFAEWPRRFDKEVDMLSLHGGAAVAFFVLVADGDRRMMKLHPHERILDRRSALDQLPLSQP